MSLPHFYLADTAYQDAISGLEPTGSLHEMYVDLEPVSIIQTFLYFSESFL